MMAGIPDGSWAASASTVMVAASQLIKDVPKTLIDMSEAVTEAAGDVAPYTNADGSFTSAAEVVEVRRSVVQTSCALTLTGVPP